MSSNDKIVSVKTGPTSEQVKIVEPVSPLHVFALRGTIVGCGLLGAYLFMRNSKLFARFKHISEIPETYIRKETKLKGTIRALDSNGVFKVEHLPEISLPRLLQPRKHATDLLRLRLAGLDVSKVGVDYLIKDLKLKDRKIIFNIIKQTANDSDTADADIAIKKSLLGAVNLNIDLIRKGYARVYTLDTPSHYEALQKNSSYSRLITKLLMSEKVAEKRGIGVWERESWVESVQSFPYAASQIVRSSSITKFIVLLGRVIYDLCVLVIQVLRQGYHFGVAVASYSAVAYRSFGHKVDRVSKFYDKQKLRLQGHRSPAHQPPVIKKD
jgi:hypothetical protein